MMKISEHGIAVIKNFEGLKLKAYRDVAGTWTIGYGSTRYHDGKTISPGDKLTDEQQAAALFKNTLSTYADVVNQKVKVPLTQNQFDALVSFTYNTGTSALQKSTLLEVLNHNNYAGAADQLLSWNKVTDPKTGKKLVCKTLSERRRAERELFLKNV